ncbi:hypothetical protein GGD63_001098 [Bradyrhizobium sp. cir1]|uniref:hypothetical protein n=1 Tax=Bradyrhizobium sp. cir1 TaxID=1445730 RepID=UPI0016062C93|nr:hypothetical protein [Bradyrhizobium sp. cir1]MBB4368319.1 hypothetical protein [Bradyrhizobium sp. cir1]
MGLKRVFKEELTPSGPIRPTIYFQELSGKWRTEVNINSDRKPYYEAPASEDVIQSLTAEISRIAGHSAFGPDFDATGSDSQTHIRLLAECGRKLFDALVPKDLRKNFLDRLLEGATLRMGQPTNQRGVVILSGQACRIWWPLMFVDELPNDPAATIDIRGFLGSRLIFIADCDSRVVGGGLNLRADRPASLETALTSSERPIVRHIWDNRFLSDNLPVNDRWYDGIDDVDLNAIEPLLNSPDEYADMIDQLLDFVVQGGDTVHLDCHGLPSDPEKPWKISLGVRNDFVAKYQDLLRLEFSGNFSIGILNVCLSGRSKVADSTVSFAENLIANKMVAAIAPMSEAPIFLLMNFSKSVYKALLSGETLLSAFDSAQTQLLAVGNPAAHALILFTSSFPWVASTTFAQGDNSVAKVA